MELKIKTNLKQLFNCNFSVAFELIEEKQKCIYIKDT